MKSLDPAKEASKILKRWEAKEDMMITKVNANDKISDLELPKNLRRGRN